MWTFQVCFIDKKTSNFDIFKYRAAPLGEYDANYTYYIKNELQKKFKSIEFASGWVSIIDFKFNDKEDEDYFQLWLHDIMTIEVYE